ncbi:MAG: ABC transporter permease, partial [Enterococcus sp.]
MKGSELNTLKSPNVFVKFKNSASFGIVIILVSLCVILTITAGTSFLSSDNLISVFRQFSFTAILAIGECLVIITSGIDLSVGSIFAFSGVIGGMAMANLGMGAAGGLAVGCAAGLAFGLANGLFVTKLKLPPFIATLGTMSIARGLSYGITGGYPINKLPDDFKFLGQGYIAGIPTPIVLLIIVA